MSSSSPDRTVRGAVIAALVAVAAPAFGADTYFQPVVEAATEYSTNRDLLADDATSPLKQEVIGYQARINGVAGVRTPRSDTRLMPRIVLQEYPDRDDLARVNGSLSLRNTYTSPLSRWSLTGSVSRQDRTNLLYLPAGYDDGSGAEPPVDDAGRVNFTPETVTSLQVRPQFSRSLNQKVDLELEGAWQKSSRNSDIASRDIDFDSWTVQGGLGWQPRERTRMSLGAYATSYSTSDDSNSTDGTGGAFALTRQWSPTYSTTLSVDVERTEVETRAAGGTGPRVRVEETNPAASLELARQGEIDEWRLFAGRTFSPTNYGNRSNYDQLRVQYRRRLSPLLELTTAVNGIRTEAQGSVASRQDDRTYIGGQLALRWNVSRTWYLRGEYTFAWQEYRYDAANSGGTGHVVLLAVGYQGLAPQVLRPVR
jgi:hypothetical protein